MAKTIDIAVKRSEDQGGYHHQHKSFPARLRVSIAIDRGKLVERAWIIDVRRPEALVYVRSRIRELMKDLDLTCLDEHGGG